MSKLLGSAAALVLLLAPVSALAAPGDLDPSFAEHGIASVRSLDVSAPATDGQGSVFYIWEATRGTPEVGKLRGDGSIDPTFGRDGRAALTGMSSVAELLVDGSGRLVAAGSNALDVTGEPSQSSMAVTRLLPDGSPDPTFGESGVADLGLAGEITDASETLRGGVVLSATTDDLRAVALRQLPGGELDPGFGLGGVVELATGATGEAVTSLSGGRVLVGVQDSSTTEFELSRLQPDGSIDSTYGSGGSTTVLPARGSSGKLSSVALTLNGNEDALLAGTASIEGSHGASLTPVGQIVSPTGGLGSSLTSHLRPFTEVTDGAFDGRGRIVLVGRRQHSFYPFTNPVTDDSVVARFTQDGAPDRGFGEGGVATFPTFLSTFPAGGLTGVAVTPDDSIVASGPGAIVRFSGNPGRADADADGVSDRDDGCPFRYSARQSGCRRFEISLSAKRSKGRIHGRLLGPSVCRGRITIFLASHGPDEGVDTANIKRGGQWQSARLAPGAYYAAYPERLVPGIGICDSSESRRLRM